MVARNSIMSPFKRKLSNAQRDLRNLYQSHYCNSDFVFTAQYLEDNQLVIIDLYKAIKKIKLAQISDNPLNNKDQSSVFKFSKCISNIANSPSACNSFVKGRRVYLIFASYIDVGQERSVDRAIALNFLKIWRPRSYQRSESNLDTVLYNVRC